MSLIEQFQGRFTKVPVERQSGLTQSSNEWYGQWIKQNLNNFPAQSISNAGVLLAEYVQGFNDTYAHFDPGSTANIPPVFILSGLAKLQPTDPTYYEFMNHRVVLREGTLKNEAKYDPEQESVWTGEKTQDISFIGTAKDHFRLMGAEEAHHSTPLGRSLLDDSFRNHALRNGVGGPDEDYHNAQTLEYQALQWKILYAQQQGMQQATIDVLQDILRKAQNVRAKFGMTI